MKTYVDCYPCFLRQAISAARYGHGDETQLQTIVQRTLEALQIQPLGATPPEIGAIVHRIVRETLGVEDPYLEEKQKATRQALQSYPQLKTLIGHQDQLETAFRISIAGNIIDLGISSAYDNLDATVQRILHQPFAINHLDAFRERLQRVKAILFIGDNAGETVYDRVLIEALAVQVTYVVKGSPVLNDATLEDALEAGLDQCATIVSNGSDAPGTVLPVCSPGFRKIFEEAELVIAKGQGNYETLSESGEKVFCLLQVKCPVIAGDIGVPVGSIVVKQAERGTNND